MTELLWRGGVRGMCARVHARACAARICTLHYMCIHSLHAWQYVCVGGGALVVAAERQKHEIAHHINTDSLTLAINSRS